MQPISILLVDDNPVFLRIATHFLQQQAEVVIVGVASRGEEALGQIQDLRPQVVLLDLSLPGLSGLEVIPLLRIKLPKVKIIALTLMDADGYRQAALAAGADDFVSKTTLNIHLLPAIRRAVQTDRMRAAYS